MQRIVLLVVRQKDACDDIINWKASGVCLMVVDVVVGVVDDDNVLSSQKEH